MKLIIFISIVLILVIVALLITYFHTKSLLVKKYTIKDKNVLNYDNEKYQIKILFFSDLHIGKTLKKKNLKRFVSYLLSFKADLYIFGGDIIGDNIKKYYTIADVEECFLPLKDKCCVAVYGNHEFKNEKNITIAEKLKYFEAMGFNTLNNEEFVFFKNNNFIKIYGMNDIIYNELKLPSKEYDLVICHEGDIINKMSNQILLSGHTHGGQIRIPFLPYIYLPKYGKEYVSGLYNVDNNKIIVSNGVGCNKFNIRFFAKRDIILINYIK